MPPFKPRIVTKEDAEDESEQPSIVALEATYLRSLRLVVQRQVEANSGVVTKKKTEAANRANKLMGLAQAKVLAVYLTDEAAKGEDQS